MNLLFLIDKFQRISIAIHDYINYNNTKLAHTLYYCEFIDSFNDCKFYIKGFLKILRIPPWDSLLVAYI